MRVPVALTLAPLSILVLSLPTPAQKAPVAAPAQYSLSIRSATCPIDLDVRHEAGLHASVQAHFDNPPTNPPIAESFVRGTPSQQSLALDIRNVGNRNIASIDLLIQTESNNLHGSPMFLRSGDSFQAEPGEQFPLHLARTIDAQQESRFAHSIPSLHAIAFIELHQVTYEDGSSWAPSAEQECRYQLDPLLLVAAH